MVRPKSSSSLFVLFTFFVLFSFASARAAPSRRLVQHLGTTSLAEANPDHRVHVRVALAQKNLERGYDHLIGV